MTWNSLKILSKKLIEEKKGFLHFCYFLNLFLFFHFSDFLNVCLKKTFFWKLKNIRFRQFSFIFFFQTKMLFDKKVRRIFFFFSFFRIFFLFFFFFSKKKLFKVKKKTFDFRVFFKKIRKIIFQRKMLYKQFLLYLLLIK